MNALDLVELTRNHFRAAMEKNVDEILASYSETSDLLVFIEGPRWATLGYDKVAKGWRDFCNSAIHLKKCDWVENLQAKKDENMGFVAGILELEVEVASITKKIRFRASFILRNEGDRWRIIHEHVSQPAPDPYGIGDWLKT